jgi:hypothetical protein
MRKVGFISMKTWKIVKRMVGEARAGVWPKEGLRWGEDASVATGQKENIQKGRSHDVKGSDDESTSAALPDENILSKNDNEQRD